ncbi:MAG: hypothetical protein E7618_00315 [Ruminococcaceae bacterium]|nr:hypothetical protein [Oscillospiraceae bacterium]
MKHYVRFLILLLLLSALLTGCHSSLGVESPATTTANDIPDTSSETDKNIFDKIKMLNASMRGSDVIELLGEDYELLCDGKTESVLTYALFDESYLFVVLRGHPQYTTPYWQQIPPLVSLEEQCIRALYLNGKALQTDEAGNFLLPDA